MSSAAAKALLKQAREALTAGKAADAAGLCQELLKDEPANYNALVFLGKAQADLGKVAEAEKAYRQAAAAAASDQPLAWQGLVSLFEKHGSQAQKAASLKDLVEFYAKTEGSDKKKTVEAIAKLLDVCATLSPSEGLPIYMALTSAPVGASIDGSNGLPTLFGLFEKCVATAEIEEKQRIDRMVESERRSIRNTGTHAELVRRVQTQEMNNVVLEPVWFGWLAAAQDNVQKLKALSGLVKRLRFKSSTTADSKQKTIVEADLATACAQYVDLLEANADLTANEEAQKLISHDAFEATLEKLLITEGIFSPAVASSLEKAFVLLSRLPEQQQKTDSPLIVFLFAIQALLRCVAEEGLVTAQAELADAATLTNALSSQPNQSSLIVQLALLELQWRSNLPPWSVLSGLGDMILKNIATVMGVTEGEVAQKSVLAVWAHIRAAQNLSKLKIANVFWASRRLQTAVSSPVATAALKYQGFMQLARFQLEQGLPEAADNSLNEASALCEAGSFNKIVVAGEQAWLTAIGVDELPALKTASDEAYQWPSRTVLQSREAAILRLRLGKLYWILGGEYRTSKEFCQTACLQSVQLDPSLAGNYTQLGQYYRLLGDGPRARKCFQKAISLDLEREVAAAQELADIHMEASEIQEARALYEQVATSSPTMLWGHKRLGLHRLSIDRDSMAAQIELQAALRISEQDIECWLALGEAYLDQGKHMAALKAFQRCVELDGTNDSRVAIDALYRIAVTQHALGLHDDAVQNLSLYHTKTEPSVLSLKSLADCYYEQAQYLLQQGRFGASSNATVAAVQTVFDAFTIVPAAAKMSYFWKLLGDVLVGASELPNWVEQLWSSPAIEGIKGLFTSGPLPLQRMLEDATVSAGLAAFNKLVGASSVQKGRVLVDQVLQLAFECYRHALAMFPSAAGESVSLLWADVGLSFLLRVPNLLKCDALASITSAASKECILNVVAKSFREGLRQDPTDEHLWNKLGVALCWLSIHGTAPKGSDQAKELATLSQHAFIQSLKYSPKSASAWTNLGWLYLLLDDLELANKSFSAAQVINPDMPECWVGQAVIASAISSHDAQELWLHCFVLSGGTSIEINSKVSDLLYQRVLQHKKTPSYETVRTATIASEAATGLFAALKLVEKDEAVTTAQQNLGFLWEWQGVHVCAVDAFSRVAATLSGDGWAKINLGRAQWASQQYPEAIAGLEAGITIVLADQESKKSLSSVVLAVLTCGLAYFSSNDLATALAKFQQALALCNDASFTNDFVTEEGLGDLRSYVVTCLCQVLFALKGPNEQALARQEMLRLIESNPSNVAALLFLAAFGLQTGDVALAAGALGDLVRLPPMIVQRHDPNGICMFDLLVRMYIQSSNVAAAETALARAVQRYPWEASHYSRYASFLAKHHPASHQLIGAATSLSATSLALNSRTNIVAAWRARAETLQTAGVVDKFVPSGSKPVPSLAVSTMYSIAQEAARSYQKCLMAEPWKAQAWSLVASGLRATSAFETQIPGLEADPRVASVAERMLVYVDQLSSAQPQLMMHSRIAMAEWRTFSAAQQPAEHVAALLQEAIGLLSPVAQLAESRGDAHMASLAHLHTGLAEYAQGNLPAAINSLQLSIKLNANQSLAWTAMAEIYGAAGQLGTAKQALQQALDATSKDLVHHGLLHVHMSRLAEQENDPAAMLAASNKAQEFFPQATAGIGSDLIVRWLGARGMHMRETQEGGTTFARTVKQVQPIVARDPEYPMLPPT